MPSRPATALASCRSSSAQQRPKEGPAPSVWSWSCMEIPTSSWPCSWSSAAATEESTPPDMATAMRMAGRRLLHVGNDEHQHVAADAELHLVGQHLLFDPLQLHEGAVGRAEVAQDGLLAEHLDRRVQAGGLGVVQVHVRARAPDAGARLRDLEDVPGGG